MSWWQGSGDQRTQQAGGLPGENFDTGSSYLLRCLDAICEMSPRKLDALLSSASVAMTVPRLLNGR